MDIDSHTSLAKLSLDTCVRETLVSLWITSAEELISLTTAVKESAVLLKGIDVEGGNLSKTLSAARNALSRGQLDRLSIPKAGGSLGCVLDPQLLEDFKQYGRVRPLAAKPAGVFEGKLPSSVRLMDRMPPVKNQGERGTCVAFGTVALREFLLEKYVELSEQFLYWACKQLDGNPGPGTNLHTAMTALTEYGVSKASVWPYNPLQTDDEGQGPPPDEALKNAKDYALQSTRTVEPNLVVHYKNVLAGHEDVPQMPVSFTTLVFNSWYLSPETHRTGKITIPLPGEQPVSGHAWCVVGYVDDDEAPGGGYFIVRNSWGTTWAQDSPEAPGHAVIPYEYVELYAIEAYSGPLTKCTDSRPETDSEFREYVRILSEDERDIEGRLIRSGSAVLCHPSDPGKFKEDTPANRQEFLKLDYSWTDEVRQRVWFHSAKELPQETRDTLEACRAAKREFVSAIDENLNSARGDIFPEVGLPFWTLLLLWEPRIKHVTTVSDIGKDIAGRVKSNCGVPDDLDWPSAWQELLEELNVGKIYSAKCAGATIHVVTAFVCQLRLQRNTPVAIVDPAQTMVEAVYDAYQVWTSNRKTAKPVLTFYSIGSAQEWSHNVVADASAAHWTVITHYQPDGTWKVIVPAGFIGRLSVRNFVDRLKPETQRQRISRTKDSVDRLLDSGYEGNITIDKIANQTGFRRTYVRDAFLTLQENGHHRLYWTGQRVLAIDRHLGRTGPKITAANFERSWIRRELFTWLAPAGGIAIWFVANAIFGEPFHGLKFLVMLLLAYPGRFVDRYLNVRRENRE